MNFICPDCGSGYFGADETMVFCHGYTLNPRTGEAKSCNFQGPREGNFHESLPPHVLQARRLYSILIETPKFDRLVLTPKVVAQCLKELDAGYGPK